MPRARDTTCRRPHRGSQLSGMRTFCALATVALVACVAAPYEEWEWWTGTGYWEAQLEEDTFRVSFKGNGFTSDERLEDLAMLRAAQITLDNGFEYFVIVDEAPDEFALLGGPAMTPISDHVLVGVSGKIRKLIVTKTIQCFHEAPPDAPMALDAQSSARSIRSKYGLD